MNDTYAEQFLRFIKAHNELTSLGYDLKPCPTCEGKGVKTFIEETIKIRRISELKCEACDGRGTTYQLTRVNLPEEPIT